MEFNHNQYLEYRIFDFLIDYNIRFALYRLPGEHDINLILQTSPNENQFENLSELNNKQGFVIAPFQISERNPIVLIKPDIVIAGQNAILSYIKDFISITSNNPVSQTFVGDNISDTFEAYSKAYSVFQTTLADGNIQKLVLSRTLKKERRQDFSIGESFLKACKTYPDNFVYLCNTPETGSWLGCSPELLIAGQESSWKTVALAGTKDNSTTDWDNKNRIEQQIVADYMQQQLELGGYRYTESKPVTIESGNIKHIKTDFSFESDSSASVGDLLELLHPSPAVCGFPKKEAFEFIVANEGYNRSYYSGFLGCINMMGKTEVYVNLRCMKIYKDILELYAGGGILTSSSLKSEWEETEKKLQTILSIIDK